MNKNRLLILLPILLAAGVGGRVEAAMTFGEVGQSVSVSANWVGSLNDTGTGTVSRSMTGEYYDPGFVDSLGSPNSWNSYDYKAHASPGSVGTYLDYRYVFGGGDGGGGASAQSGDIFTVYDPAHASGVVGVTFNANVHGTLFSSGNFVTGRAGATVVLGEPSSSYPYWNVTQVNTLFRDFTENGITTQVESSPSRYTYNLTLDASGHGQLAVLLGLYTTGQENATSWDNSLGGTVLGDYFNTVSMSVASQYDTTTITSQGGWNVGNTNPVPVPAAGWLFGSGLLGLVGVARRKARAA